LVADTHADLTVEDVDPHIVSLVDVPGDQVTRLHRLLDERDDAVGRFVRDDDALALRSDVYLGHGRDGIVDCDMRKWGDVAHWRFPASLLGRDAYGTWLGALPPTPYTGPRGAGDWTHNFVVLVPEDEWWIATFNERTDDWPTVYVDITTPPRWTAPDRVTAIDLDLDVIRFQDDRIMLDDEDEFEAHRVSYGYPSDIVDAARTSAASILARVEARDEPFGEAFTKWLTK
jgi:hypothetical protein